MAYKGQSVSFIAAGGGLHAAFAAGAMTAMHTELDDFSMHNVDTFVGVSASSSGLAHFLSEGDGIQSRKIWTKELSSKKFMNNPSILEILTAKEPVLNVSYLIDTIFKERFPYDIDAIKNTAQRFYFPIYNYDLDQVEYVTNNPTPQTILREGKEVPVHSLESLNLYEALRASHAIPIFYDKTVPLGKHSYVDGSIIDPYTFDIPESKTQKRFLFTSSSDTTLRNTLKFVCVGALTSTLLPLTKPESLKRSIYRKVVPRHRVYKRLDEQAKTLTDQGTLFHVQPHKKLGKFTDNSLSSLEYNFDTGVEYVKENKDLITSFLKTPTSLPN